MVQPDQEEIEAQLVICDGHICEGLEFVPVNQAIHCGGWRGIVLGTD